MKFLSSRSGSAAPRPRGAADATTPPTPRRSAFERRADARERRREQRARLRRVERQVERPRVREAGGARALDAFASRHAEPLEQQRAVVEARERLRARDV